MNFCSRSDICLCTLILIFVITRQTSANDRSKARKQDFYCSACKSMSETIFHDLNNVDRNERIQVGSYRVDGHGHQKLKEVPIIETRFHIENVLENLCSKSFNSGQRKFESHLKNLHEHACDDILEEHHDNLIEFLLEQAKRIETDRLLADLLCVKTYVLCKADELEHFYEADVPIVDEQQGNGNDETGDNQSKADL